VGRTAIIIIVAIVVALFIFTRHPSTSDGAAVQTGGNGTTTGHLSVVPTIRSVTVSPGAVTFGDCTGGNGYTDSTAGSMGYPNGSCTVGNLTVPETFPISITYTGIPGDVYVNGSNAAPSDNGTGWSLCSPGGIPSGQPACTASQGNQPGEDQYMVLNVAANEKNSGVLTTTPACDKVFDAGGGCSATPQEYKNQVQHEALLLTGPSIWDDHSTSWTMTVTWTAVGSSS
jgi:hypothetical protein